MTDANNETPQNTPNTDQTPAIPDSSELTSPNSNETEQDFVPEPPSTWVYKNYSGPPDSSGAKSSEQSEGE